MPRLGWGWVLVLARIAAILLWFAIIILPHWLLTLAGHRLIVPPVFLAGVGWLAGLRVRTEDAPAPRPLLLVSNHVSWLDILALAGVARVAFVAKDNLTEQPFLHWLARQNATVFIARDRRGTIAQQVRAIEAGLARRRLVVFPEGTTGDGRQMFPFKSALLAAAEGARADGMAVTVQPVALVYHEADEIAWVGEEPGLHNVLRVLGRVRPVHLTVRYCGPLRGAQLEGRKAMAGAAQAAVARALAD